jgi:hypothetical protein
MQLIVLDDGMDVTIAERSRKEGYFLFHAA